MLHYTFCVVWEFLQDKFRSSAFSLFWCTGLSTWTILMKPPDIPSPKLTAKAPENRPKPKRKGSYSNRFQPSIFRCTLAVSFREGIHFRLACFENECLSPPSITYQKIAVVSCFQNFKESQACKIQRLGGCKITLLRCSLGGGFNFF